MSHYKQDRTVQLRHVFVVFRCDRCGYERDARIVATVAGEISAMPDGWTTISRGRVMLHFCASCDEVLDKALKRVGAPN